MIRTTIQAWRWPLLLGLIVAAIAWQATLRRTPYVLMSAAEKRLGKMGGVNQMAHGPLADSASRAVVRPSPDLAYSTCVFDLSNGPVTVTAAPVPARYWSLSVFDARTDVAFVRNNVESQGAPIRIVLIRDGQTAPPGTTAVLVPGGHGIALIRILVDDRARFAMVDQARRASCCGPVAP
ncbi:DUF1254 domain-containing protein [Sphingomonas sp.]|jgi:uncharacterized membrane protein|uniref:DUF1254 domain-containing protein n=1 Tax=Sphingomonas sp. TaxID=28214 RepID=UPI0035C8046F